MNMRLRWAATASFYGFEFVLFVLSANDKRVLQFIVKPIILLECFIALGLIASDYLTPSLSQISNKILHISDKISGLTLLALGNSIPDMTSTYQAMSSGSTSLALGELLGGIFFLLTVVLSVMALVKPIELGKGKITLTDANNEYEEIGDLPVFYNRVDFFQDIVVFGSLIFMSAFFLADGHLRFWECITMIVTYSFYTAFLVLKHKDSEDDLVEDDACNMYDTEDLSTIISNSNGLNDGEANILLFNRGVNERRANLRRRIRQYLRSRYHGWVRITLSDCLDIWENEGRFNKTLKELAGSERNSIAPSEDQIEDANFTHIRRTASFQCYNRPEPLPNISGLDDQSMTESVISSTHMSDAEAPDIDPGRLSLPLRPKTQKSLSCDYIPIFPNENRERNVAEEETQDVSANSKPDDVLLTWPQNYKLVQYLADGSMYLPKTEFSALLFTTPITFLLSCLIPYLGQAKEKGKLHLFEVLRLSLSPLILCFVLTSSLTVSCLVVSGLLVTVLTYRWCKLRVRYNKNIVAVAGFILSLSLIYSCVRIVVTILTDWSSEFNISPSILGLTVFAWGNSMGDLVSNVIFVDIGVIELALGACFGSPLLYFVFGVGINGILLMMQQQEQEQSIIHRHLDYVVDTHLGYTAFGILVAFLIFLVAVPMNNCRIDYKISASLLGLYTIITALNIYQEIGGCR